MSARSWLEDLKPGDHVIHVLPFGPPRLCEIVECFYFAATVRYVDSGYACQVYYDSLRQPTPLELLAMEAP